MLPQEIGFPCVHVIQCNSLSAQQPAGGGVDFLSGLRMFVSIQSIAGDASKYGHYRHVV